MDNNLYSWNPRKLPFTIDGYNLGDNISLLNVIYHRREKDLESDRYLPDCIDIIFKDISTKNKRNFRYILLLRYKLH
jgi:hypothetical protein